jgi:hypothetical protein
VRVRPAANAAGLSSRAKEADRLVGLNCQRARRARSDGASPGEGMVENKQDDRAHRRRDHKTPQTGLRTFGGVDRGQCLRRPQSGLWHHSRRVEILPRMYQYRSTVRISVISRVMCSWPALDRTFHYFSTFDVADLPLIRPEQGREFALAKLKYGPATLRSALLKHRWLHFHGLSCFMRQLRGGLAGHSSPCVDGAVNA